MLPPRIAAQIARAAAVLILIADAVLCSAEFKPSSQGNSVTVSPRRSAELKSDPISVTIRTRHISGENPEFEDHVPEWEKGVKEEYRGKEVRLTPVLEVCNYVPVEVKDG